MSFDVIIVGARVAGAATALLLARADYEFWSSTEPISRSDTAATTPDPAAGRRARLAVLVCWNRCWMPGPAHAPCPLPSR